MATENLNLATNELTDTVKECIIDNFNDNMGKIDAALGELKSGQLAVVTTSSATSPTSITAWRSGQIAMVAGYVTCAAGASTVATCNEVKPLGSSAEAVQFPISAGNDNCGFGIVKRTSSGLEIKMNTSKSGTFRFSAAFPCEDA